jgi:hypothetical protein
LSSTPWRALGVAGLCVVLAGCAAIPWPHAAWDLATQRSGEGWLDLRGAIHVHTQASHDSPGTIEAVVAAAHGAGMAWIALTEHVKPGVLGPYGSIDGITVIPGFELRAAGASLLALGTSQLPPPTRDPAALVRLVHEAGGVAFVGHFEHSRLAEPDAYQRAAPDGVELVNLHANSKARRGSLLWRVPLLPSSLALRSLSFVLPENLARWEALPGPPPIVGAVDAHAKFRLLGPLGGTVDRYRDVFPLLTTHVLARAATAASILEALASGRSYVALEGIGRVDAFRFEPAPGGFLLEAPLEAELTLLCDGQRAATTTALRALLAPPHGAKSCRAEARRGGRLWVLTSPRGLPMPKP